MSRSLPAVLSHPFRLTPPPVTLPEGSLLGVLVVSQPTQRTMPDTESWPRSPSRTYLPTRSGYLVRARRLSARKVGVLPLSTAELGASSENCSSVPSAVGMV